MSGPLGSEKFDPAGLEARIEAIGRTEFEEARAVLRQDGLLPAQVSDRAAYTVFAAVFLELTYFDPPARSIVFPAIEVRRCRRIGAGQRPRRRGSARRHAAGRRAGAFACPERRRRR